MRAKLTIPVCNEEPDLLTSIPALREFLNGVTLFKSSPVIAENSNRLIVVIRNGSGSRKVHSTQFRTITA